MKNEKSEFVKENLEFIIDLFSNNKQLNDERNVLIDILNTLKEENDEPIEKINNDKTWLDLNYEDFLNINKLYHNKYGHFFKSYEMKGSYTKESMLKFIEEIKLNAENGKANIEKLLNGYSSDEMKRLCTIYVMTFDDFDLSPEQSEAYESIINHAKYKHECMKIKHYHNKIKCIETEFHITKIK